MFPKLQGFASLAEAVPNVNFRFGLVTESRGNWPIMSEIFPRRVDPWKKPWV
jgi:hypothetical protein